MDDHRHHSLPPRRQAGGYDSRHGARDELHVGYDLERLLWIETTLGSMDDHLDRYATLMEEVSDE